MEKKRRHILRAIAGGNSCEQILANNPALTYHDIFHVLTEAPTTFWGKPQRRPGFATPRETQRHRCD